MVFQTYLRSGQGHYLESPWFLVMIAVDDSNVSTSNLWRLESFIPHHVSKTHHFKALMIWNPPTVIGTKGLVFPGALTSFIDTGKTSFKTTILYFPLSQYGENRHFLLLSFENWRTQKARWILLPSPSCWIAISHDFTHHLYQASVLESSALSCEMQSKGTAPTSRLPATWHHSGVVHARDTKGPVQHTN